MTNPVLVLPVWEIAVHLAVACDVFIDVSLCCSFFPLDVLDGIWDLIGSPTFFLNESETLLIFKDFKTFERKSR